MNLRNIKAAIFDLDGTIADSMGIWDRIDDEFFNKHGIEQTGDYKDIIKTMGFRKAAEYTKARFDFRITVQEIVDEWFQMSLNEYAFNVKLKPGAGEFIKKLKAAGLKIGLATATGQRLFEPLLKRCGVFDCFDVFATTEEAGKDKNYPDVYILCAGRLSVPPQNCMVFEDILAGIKSAKSAGMKTTGVFDRRSILEKEQILKETDYFLNSFNEIINDVEF